VQRVRKIGSEKASIFQKNFDVVYDFWRKKAEDDFNYFGELKLKKERGKVIIYILLPDIEDGELIDPDDYDEI
jgi:hypothetical protein